MRLQDDIDDTGHSRLTVTDYWSKRKQGQCRKTLRDHFPVLFLERSVLGQCQVKAERLEQAAVCMGLPREDSMEGVDTEPRCLGLLHDDTCTMLGCKLVARLRAQRGVGEAYGLSDCA